MSFGVRTNKKRTALLVGGKRISGDGGRYANTNPNRMPASMRHAPTPRGPEPHMQWSHRLNVGGKVRHTNVAKLHVALGRKVGLELKINKKGTRMHRPSDRKPPNLRRSRNRDMRYITAGR
jgi:hypothetical protein